MTTPVHPGTQEPPLARALVPDPGLLRERTLLLEHSGTADCVADLLRSHITEGALPPGTRLSEEALVTAVGVSRNTLREAFRLLTHEGLLVHRLHRGVFVPELEADDVVDLYRLRRAVECDAVLGLIGVTPDRLASVYAAVTEGEEAAARSAWREAGTANMRFHERVVALAGSRRTDALTRRLLAELRLAFHVVPEPGSLYGPFVPRNRELADVLATGDTRAAAAYLESYLAESRERLVAAHLARGSQA